MSQATNLVNLLLMGNMVDVYVRDTWSNTTVLVSINRTGTNRGNFSSFSPIMTPDGARVLFSSGARDLVDPHISFGLPVINLFVRDLVAQTTTLLSDNFRGTAAVGSTYAPGYNMSTNGLVVFASTGTNIVRVPVSSPTSDVFLRRLSP